MQTGITLVVLQAKFRDSSPIKTKIVRKCPPNIKIGLVKS